MATEFKPLRAGDIIDLVVWDNGIDAWLRGIVMVVDYNPTVSHTKHGCYELKKLEGQIDYCLINVDFVGEGFYNYLGNVNDSPALKILYGRPE